MTAHTKRVLTTLVGIPVLFVVIHFAPPWGFTLVTLGVALVSLNEYYGMMGSEASKKVRAAAYALTAIFFCTIVGRGVLCAPLLLFFVIVPLALFLFSAQKSAITMGEVGQVILGPLYVCVPLSLLAVIARLPQGERWVFFILATIFAGDIGSFYVGRLLGKHKLSRISPGKTWEGAIGGLLANLVCGGSFAILFIPSLSLTTTMVLAIVLGAIGQVGDLAESMLKRLSRMKDSGRTLPGHGGMLDRIDGFLFAVPALYLYLNSRCVWGP
jgi:phosphatidate cytidylyltransferase